MDKEAFRLVLAFDASPAAVQAARFVAAHDGASTQGLVLIVPPREALAAQGERELDAARAALQDAPAELEYAVRVGFPPEVIVAEARDRAAHVIVAGTRARGGAMGLGSVSSEILRGSEFPLLLVKQDARIPPALGRTARVVLATDGSAHSVRAAGLVQAWLDWLGQVEAHVVHALETMPLLDKLVPPHRDSLHQESEQHAQQTVRACASALSGCEAVHTHVVSGDPATCIARLAADAGADLVVMGTHGRGARSHALFGSIAMKTVQWSPVPVVLVP
jgi:nucleotide-binding universal stress UspA family protein